MLWLCWIGLALSTAVIAYQDFKHKLIGVWVIAGFGICCCARFILTHSINEWFENGLFCIAYFMLCYLVLHLFYFLKMKRFQKIIDVKIGWGDILLFILTGSCIDPLFMIYFFTATFIIALLFQILFQGKSKEIALAGILAICYFLFTLVNSFLLLYL